jgi:hypothetical protein
MVYEAYKRFMRFVILLEFHITFSMHRAPEYDSSRDPIFRRQFPIGIALYGTG